MTSKILLAVVLICGNAICAVPLADSRNLGINYGNQQKSSHADALVPPEVHMRRRRNSQLEGIPVDTGYGVMDGLDQFGNRERYYDTVDRGPSVEERSFDSLGGGEIPLFQRRSFDSLGGGEIPLFQRRSFDSLGGGMIPLADKRTRVYAPRVHQRSFDSLGGGEIPLIKRRAFEKREERKRK